MVSQRNDFIRGGKSAIDSNTAVAVFGNDKTFKHSFSHVFQRVPFHVVCERSIYRVCFLFTLFDLI